ncbi:hypothetical protein [Williamsia phyllosphaerae]|uniref:Uncharacterized protein n=1 Tax=Williamsia phyllosphaerae TaxID=885042 RepID=A0ABQ1V4U3_9NOCA|nr:hypothetical protein [Williamsia phyllosphaerae]GGF38985.1 hypothetical protein GCM10007298_38360 [Williamsia phyllosphaerae]
MTDTTMQSLLDVHRTELNTRDTTIERMKFDAEKTKNYNDMRVGELERDREKRAARAAQLERENKEFVKIIDDRDAQIAKLQQATESLNQLLTSERSAFSAYRDTHPDTNGDDA